jgi:hypothetical protein
MLIILFLIDDTKFGYKGVAYSNQIPYGCIQNGFLKPAVASRSYRPDLPVPPVTAIFIFGFMIFAL